MEEETEQKERSAARSETANCSTDYIMLFIAIGILFVYFREVNHRATFDDNYTETTGKVLKQEEITRKSRPNVWYVTYEFSVYGKIYEGYDTVVITNQPPTPVFYKPEDPTSNSLDRSDNGLLGIAEGGSFHFWFWVAAIIICFAGYDIFRSKFGMKKT